MKRIYSWYFSSIDKYNKIATQVELYFPAKIELDINICNTQFSFDITLVPNLHDNQTYLGRHWAIGGKTTKVCFLCFKEGVSIQK